MPLFRRRRGDEGPDGEATTDGPGATVDTGTTTGAVPVVAGRTDDTSADAAILDEPVEGVTDDELAGDAIDDEPVPSPLSARPDGPYDASEIEDDDETQRLDLGGLRLVVPAGIEVRLDLDQQQQIVAATMVHGEELMQLGAFAAPRTEGIWDEVRAEISASIVAGGGSVTEAEGPFGVELVARVPTDTPGVFAPARFVGVNGPRWFLRALFSGPDTAQGQENAVLAAALRAVVVVRGPDAMAPRDGLPLRLPAEALASADAAVSGEAVSGVSGEAVSGEAPGGEALGGEAVSGEAPAGQAARSDQAVPVRDPLTLPERGPEITETR